MVNMFGKAIFLPKQKLECHTYQLTTRDAMVLDNAHLLELHLNNEKR